MAKKRRKTRNTKAASPAKALKAPPPGREPERPTPERILRAQEEAGEACEGLAVIEKPIEKNGPRVVYLAAHDPLSSCLAQRKISRRQYDAGVRFAELARIAGGHCSPRSSLDLARSGGALTRAEAQTQALKLWRGLCKRLGPEASGVLLSVCVNLEATGPRREGPRRWSLLLGGLSAAADHLGLGEG